MKLLTINIEGVVPRKEVEAVNIESPHYKKIVSQPIKTVYSQDLKKHIIVDGHHRYYLRKSLGRKKIKVCCVGYQKQTELKKEVPQIKWGTGSVIKYG